MCGSIELKNPHRACIQIGFYQVGTGDIRYNRTVWNNNGRVVIDTGVKLGSGTRISNSGELVLGKRFTVTADSSFICTDRIEFGDDCIVSWECLIMDSDFHKIYSENICINPDKPIIIGNNAWIGCRVTVLKGTRIADGCIVAAGSLLHGNYMTEGCILDGRRIIRKEIRWED